MTEKEKEQALERISAEQAHWQEYRQQQQVGLNLDLPDERSTIRDVAHHSLQGLTHGAAEVARGIIPRDGDIERLRPVTW